MDQALIPISTVQKFPAYITVRQNLYHFATTFFLIFLAFFKLVYFLILFIKYTRAEFFLKNPDLMSIYVHVKTK